MHACTRACVVISHVYLTCDLELGLSCGLAALVLALLNGPIYTAVWGTICLYKSSPPSASSRCAKEINNNDDDDDDSDDDSDDNGKGNSNISSRLLLYVEQSWQRHGRRYMT